MSGPRGPTPLMTCVSGERWTAMRPPSVRSSDAAYSGYVPRIGRRPAPMGADYETLIAAGEVWVGDSGGSVVGVLVIRSSDEILELENVAVDPAEQGLGHGRALIAFAESHARRAGSRGGRAVHERGDGREPPALPAARVRRDRTSASRTATGASTSERPWTLGLYRVSLVCADAKTPAWPQRLHHSPAPARPRNAVDHLGGHLRRDAGASRATPPARSSGGARQPESLADAPEAGSGSTSRSSPSTGTGSAGSSPAISERRSRTASR